MKALSIRQPWAWLIANGHKAIENRRWGTDYRGPVLIHAGKQMTNAEYHEAVDFVESISIAREEAGLGAIQVPPYQLSFQLGGIVGVADITDCVQNSDSPWFCGPFGFVLARARPLPFKPLRGALGLFDVPDVICAELGLTNQVALPDGPEAQGGPTQ